MRSRGPINWGDPVNRNHPLMQGRVAWWLSVPGQFGSTWRDLMNPYQAGTLTGMTWGSTSGFNATTRPGGFAECRFDGTNDSVVAPNSVLCQSKQTIAFWLYSNASGKIFLSNTEGAAGGWHMYVNGTGLQYTSRDPGVSQLESATGIIGAYWGHYVVTTDGTTGRIYYNGVEVSTTGSVRTPAATTKPLTIGDYSDGGGYAQGGKMDSIALYNRALTAAEVMALYQEERTGYPNVLNRVTPVAPAFAYTDQGGGDWLGGLISNPAGLINWGDPLNRESPFNRNRLGWWLAAPGHIGTRYRNLINPSMPGVLTNMTTWGASGGFNATSRPGGYYDCRFDGINDSIIVTDTGGLLSPSTMTVAGWFYVQAAVSGVLISTGDHNVSGWYLQDLGGQFTFRTNQSGTGQATTTTAAYATGTWYHIAVTLSGANARIFANGTEASYATVGSHVAPAATTSMQVGALNSASWFSGRTDSFSVWSRALTPVEINALYREEQRFCPTTLRRVNATALAYYSSGGGGSVGNGSGTQLALSSRLGFGF